VDTLGTRESDTLGSLLRDAEANKGAFVADTAIPLRVLRVAAASAVRSTSLRTTARKIGLSAPGLSNFLHGCDPRETTLQKLTEWYIRNGAQSVAVTPDLAEAGISLLLDRLPAGKVRERTRADVLRELEAAHRKARVQPPPWLASLVEGQGQSGVQ
jgi:hypothetical protein